MAFVDGVLNALFHVVLAWHTGDAIEKATTAEANALTDAHRQMSTGPARHRARPVLLRSVLKQDRGTSPQASCRVESPSATTKLASVCAGAPARVT